MKRNNLYVSLMAFAILLVGASCSDDDNTPSYSTGVVQNTELKTILVQRGYTFNEDGNLLLDDLAKNTTTLDLSGTQISTDALAELSMFPNLTDVDLSDNGYGPAFDFAKLPEQITGIDLRGNKIYDFEGLVDASVINDEVQATILHKLTKLYLPETAKWNVEDLMPFYTKNQTDGTNVDMQMEDEDENLQAYNTLREIPDEYFRAYLKMKFASLFPNDGTQIDISKPMGLTESGQSISLDFANQFEDIDKIASIEGIEYFINNPYYESFYITVTHTADTPYTLSHLMPRGNIESLVFSSVLTPDGMDLSKATGLMYVNMGDNEYLTDLDLTNTLVGKQEFEEMDASVTNAIQLKNCSNLKSIKITQNGSGLMGSIILSNLPSLESLDLSMLEGLENLVLLNIEKCELTLPTNLKYAYRSGYGTLTSFEDGGVIMLAISEDVFNKPGMKEYLTEHQDNFQDRYMSYRKEGAYRWSKNLD